MDQEQHQRQRCEDFKQLMTTPYGRRFISELLDECRVFSASYGHDDRTTNFNEGRRHIGLKLLSAINDICPELYGLMVEERNDLLSQLNEQKEDTDG